MKDYKSIAIARRNQVATITLLPRDQWLGDPEVDRHWELASCFNELREDNSIRVIVLTGSGSHFSLSPPTGSHETEVGKARHTDPTHLWITVMGALRCHQTMAEIEKPIVAKVNGNATGFGQSIVFASDIIVAREDAVLVDHHMGMGDVKGNERPFAIVPGDGSGTLIQLYMTPCKAKEYMMLAKSYTAAELARLGIINYAVPAEELNSKVDEIVNRLLERSAYALAWTKRIANRRVVEQLNLTLDAAAGYELVSLLQGHQLLGRDKKTLD